jgi:SAM-dependent methyltransferase
MAAVTRAKARAAGLNDRVAGAALPAGGIGALRPPVPFDGAYASFGALNCEPDLAGFGRAMGHLVRPGGAFVCSVMARFCPFEVVWFLRHGRPRVAFRRLRRGWQSAPVAGRASVEVSVATRYLALGDLKEVLAPAFELERTLSLPLLLPPPYLDAVFREHRRVFAYLERWERRLRHRWPWRLWGDHVVLVFRRLGGLRPPSNSPRWTTRGEDGWAPSSSPGWATRGEDGWAPSNSPRWATRGPMCQQ